MPLLRRSGPVPGNSRGPLHSALRLRSEPLEFILESLPDRLDRAPVGLRGNGYGITVQKNTPGAGNRELEGIPGAELFFLAKASATGTIGADPRRAAATTPTWT